MFWRRPFRAKGASFGDQALDALRSIEDLLEEESAPGSIVMQSVFLSDWANAAECRRVMRDFYGKKMPATTYIPQPPCDGSLLAIEAWGVGPGRGKVQIIRHADHTVIVRHDGIAWAHLGGVPPKSAAASVYDSTISAFRSADEQLTAAGFRFDEVIRTWLYLGDITGMEAEAQRYRELNRARADFYRDLKFAAAAAHPGGDKPVFPASTGIGADGSDVHLSCIAMRAERPGVTLSALENPKQTSAYDYAHQYGSESPKFCRAMAVAAGDFATTFISGTASITASETRHLRDSRRKRFKPWTTSRP